MADNFLGRLFYRIDAENNTERGTSAAERNVASTMAKISGMRAEAEVGADIRELQRKAAEAKAIMAGLEKQEAIFELKAGVDPKARYQLGRVRDQMKRATAEAKDLRNELSMKGLSLRQLRQVRTETEKNVAALKSEGVELAKLRERYNKLGDELDRINQKHRLLRTEGEKLKAVRLGREMDATRQSILRLGGSVDDINEKADDHFMRLRRWVGGLGNVRLQMGFFSLTLTQLGRAMIAFAPLVTSAIGTLSALIGVLGTGLVGATTVGIAGLAGFGLTLFGIVQAIKQMPEVADRAESGMAALGERFGKLTAGAQGDVMRGLNEGFRTANALMPMFARNVKASIGVAADETENWGAMMRGPKMRGAIDSMMQGFRGALPPLSAGLRGITMSIARIGESASRHLPGLSRGFAQWAKGLRDSLGRGDELDQRINRLVNHMQQLGHFAQASGRLLTNFFSAGADSGAGLLKSLTRTFNGWTRWMRTVEGQQTLQNFFQDSIDLASKLGPAIFNVAAAFGQFAQAAAPVMEGATAAFSAFAGVVASIPSEILTIVGAIYAVRKAAMGLAGILGVGGILSGVLGGSAGRAAAGRAAGGGLLGTILGGAAGGASAGVGLRTLATLAARTTLVGTAFAGAAFAGVKLGTAIRGLFTEDEVTQAERYADAARGNAAQLEALRRTGVKLKGIDMTPTQLLDPKAFRNQVQQVKNFIGKNPWGKDFLPAPPKPAWITNLGPRYATLLKQGMQPLRKQASDVFDAVMKPIEKPRRVKGFDIPSLFKGGGRKPPKIPAPEIGKPKAPKMPKLQIPKIKAPQIPPIKAPKMPKINIPSPKPIRLSADPSRAVSGAGVAKSAIAGVQGKTVYIDVVTRKRGGAMGGVMSGFAKGGVTEDRIERARERADKRATERSAPGQRITRPTFLAGEIANDTEWVITDNPAFRRSNMAYLADAAVALGAMVIPAFAQGAKKSGGKKKKKKGKGGGAVGLEDIEDHPLWGTYSAYHDQIDWWSREFDLDKRSYDLGLGTPMNELIGDLGAQINLWSAVLGLIPSLKQISPEPIPHIPRVKADKGKRQRRQERRREQAEEKKAQAQSFNQSRKDAFESLAEEEAEIPHLIRGLQLDMFELQNAANQSLLAGTLAANVQRYEAFQQFSGNLASASGAFAAGASASRPFGPASGGFAMPHLPQGFNAPSTGAPRNLTAAAPAVAPSGFTGPSGASGGVTVINNYQTQPSDPHTWSQQVAFELAAM